MASTKSPGSSEITGSDYHKGFCDGFVERNEDKAIEIYSNTTVYTDGRLESEPRDAATTAILLGDIDVCYEITHSCFLSSLFPVRAILQLGIEDVLLQPGDRIFIELMSSTGHSILKREGRECKLERKMIFFSTLKSLRDTVIRNNDIVIFVYNGADPATVFHEYQKLNATYRLRGGVVHFTRWNVIKWAELEKNEKLMAENAALRAALEARQESVNV